MRAFKGFNKDLTCRGYQYEEGKEFHTERAECCDTGFHACEYPLDCFGQYDPAHSVYHEVELSGEMDKSGDNTKVYQNIRVGLNCLREIQDKYLASSGENCVLMVYNMGESGAKKLWAKDIYSSAYSREVIARAQELRQELTQE